MTARGPRNGEAALRAVNETERVWLNETELVMDFFAEGAKAYWRLWGPLGEPMVRAVEEWAKMQRAYLRWVRQVIGSNRQHKSQLVWYRT
jgi:hypothetical protein